MADTPLSAPKQHYSNERNVQILVALLKARGIRRIVASPGTTNINFVWSVQYDPFFQVVSAVDERHAAYLACGMAAESGEPVVLSCTGATASRNYFPGLTEAYYRKLPILAVTATQSFSRVGNMVPQVLDRSTPPRDTVRYSVPCPIPRTPEESAACELALNRALIALRRHGGGPVHINLETGYSREFSAKELPTVRVISHIMPYDEVWPEIPSGKVVIRIGAHRPFTEQETAVIEAFAVKYDAAVFVDHTSGYRGPSAVLGALVLSQSGDLGALGIPEAPALAIHIGEISGDYPSNNIMGRSKSVWRISEDGEARDLVGKLTAVFEMPEAVFFRHYAEPGTVGPSKQAKRWQEIDAALREKIPELPYSIPWIARCVAPKLPAGSRLHLGILNSLRAWNLEHLPEGVQGTCNVGGFGIDGIVSTALGAALAAPDKLIFVAVGDLAFFYDLNAIGNRHLGKNLRILLVNNAAGAEFHLSTHPASRFGDYAKDFMAADGHFGNKSRNLVRHYATDLGLDYRAADSKESFEDSLSWFLGPSDKSLLLECFTDTADESTANQVLCSIIPPGPTPLRAKVASILPDNVRRAIKSAIKELKQ